jgi:hypothetical protein
MALFAGTLRLQVEGLEAEVKQLMEEIAQLGIALDAAHTKYAESEALILKVNQESRLRAESMWDQERAAYEADAASLRGQLLQANLDGRRWQALVNSWTWHSDGKVELDGVTYRVMAARTDNPLANFRVPVREGDSWP